MKALRRFLRRRARWGSPSLGGLVRAAISLLVAAAALLASPAVGYYQEPGLNGVASRLADRKVEIRCHTRAEQRGNEYFTDWKAEGYVEFKYLKGLKYAMPVAHFRAEHCDRLLRGLSGNLSGVKVHDFAWSLMVLVHESGHLKNQRGLSFSEPRTQCWAMQHYRSALEMMGLGHLDEVLWYSMTYIHRYEIPIFYQLQTCKLPERP